MSSTARRAASQSLRWMAADRGVLGGSRPWLVLAAALWGGRALKRAWGPGPTVTWVGELAEGEGLAVVSRSGRARR